MKSLKVIFTVVAAFLFLNLNAQNTAPFPATGNVGIGTLSPQSPLSINGQGRSDVGVYVKGTRVGIQSTVTRPTGSGWKYGVLGQAQSGAGYAVGLSGAALNNTPSNSGHAYGVLAQASNATNGRNFGVMSMLRGSNRGAAVVGWDRINHPNWGFNTNGYWAGYFIGNTHFSEKVAIGTETIPTDINGYSLADYKLFVCGGILAEEVIVPNATWCDYVFEEAYELTSLEAVENHIEENGYLHRTPSAEEVENKGLKLKDMTINQQEKIEEIFLHLIELNKEVKTLKVENANLKAQIK